MLPSLSARSNWWASRNRWNPRFLAAMERRDAEAYSLMQAGHDLRVAGATVSLQDLKITDADLTVQMAELQQDKAQIQVDYFDEQLREGLNSWEKTALAAMGTAVYLQTELAQIMRLPVFWGQSSGGLFGNVGDLGQAFSALPARLLRRQGLARPWPASNVVNKIGDCKRASRIRMSKSAGNRFCSP